LVPGAKIAATHGRMEEHLLETVMADFIAGKIDILVTTTIIESGLDIPNANTIVIERADRFGLAELYQLRGRVGRWNRQAFAYLLLPAQQMLTGNARERIAAMRRFTELGAGFRLALRDLEIRGAGNLLGKEQSGHINSIGFELYCRLLRAAVAEYRGNPTASLPEVELELDFIDWALTARPERIPAALPPDYIPCERSRIGLYRRLAETLRTEELVAVRRELRDRYGQPPPQAETFLELCELKTAVVAAGYDRLKTEAEYVTLSGPGRTHRVDGRLPRLKSRNPAEKIRELLRLLTRIDPQNSIVSGK
jgi:transcription-repair coupling factor (superfamily II helicase)